MTNARFGCWSLLLVAALALPCAAGAAGAKTKAPKASSAERVREVSRAAQALAKLGLYKGDTSGHWNPELHTALEGFQRGRGLKPSGRLNKETRLALGLEDAAPAGKGAAKGETASTP